MNAYDLLQPSRLASLVCRPALPKDTPDVMALTRTIWDGHDYVPHVWSEWLADPDGLVASAQYGGHVVGVCKLSLYSPEDWWLSGLRVDPAWQGQGVASRLHDYLVDYWLRTGSGCLRLATNAKRVQVQHLCDRTGFEKTAVFSSFSAGLLTGGTHAFRLLLETEAPAALRFALESESLLLSSGLMDLGWVWTPPREKFIADAVRQGRAWWWQGGRGLLLLGEDPEEDPPVPIIQLAACPLAALPAMLRDYCRLVGSDGYGKAFWAAPLHPKLLPALEKAGFERTWEHSVYIYTKKHPGNASF